MGKLKDMWKEATKSESVELWERPLIARMLWKDRFVFSNSVFRDWWVVQKNRHIFFSMLLSHPLHPFSRRERICMVLALMMFGYVLAAGFELLLSETEAVLKNNLARKVALQSRRLFDGGRRIGVVGLALVAAHERTYVVAHLALQPRHSPSHRQVATSRPVRKTTP